MLTWLSLKLLNKCKTELCILQPKDGINSTCNVFISSSGLGSPHLTEQILPNEIIHCSKTISNGMHMLGYLYRQMKRLQNNDGYNSGHSLSSASNPTRFMQTCLSNGSVSALAKKHYAYVFKLAKLQTLTIVQMDREDEANDSTQEFQHEKTSPRCIHVSKAWSLAVDFHGQLNSYFAGKGSSDLTRCKRFSTDLQLFYASYSLCISLQHKGES